MPSPGIEVILLGWSQGGGTLPRWALRWWPDIRPMVSSLIGLAPLHNIGSVVGNAPCVIGSCFPAAWQQSVGSQLTGGARGGTADVPRHRLHADLHGARRGGDAERRRGAVHPAGGIRRHQRGHPGRPARSTCPSTSTIISSPTACAIALGAIRHPGRPADLSRVSVSQPCLPGTMPHVDPVDLLTYEATIALNVGPRLMEGLVDREPELACYVRATC